MGTWGTGPFDDDNASDWVWEVQVADDWSVVEKALRGAADVDAASYLEAPDAQIAWAAAAVVAGADDPSQAGEVEDWLSQHRDKRPPELPRLAVAALRRVLAENSELRELWEEAGEDEWRGNVERLAAALQASG